MIVLLNAEWDHPDVFADDEAVLDAFESWINARTGRRTLVANVSDAGVRKIVDRLADWHGRADVGSMSRPTCGPRTMTMPSCGSGLVVTAADAASTRPACPAATTRQRDDGRGRDTQHPRRSRRRVAGFRGVGRRLELKGDVGGVVVLDDYGHHPTAIARTLEAVRASATRAGGCGRSTSR